MLRSELNHGLNYAAEDGDLEAVKEALEKGAEIDAKPEASPALITAARFGHSQIVEFLLSKGADVNARCGHSGTGWTALMYASFYGHFGIVILLYETGADITLMDGEHHNALDLALDTTLAYRTYYHNMRIIDYLAAKTMQYLFDNDFTAKETGA